MPHDDRHLNFHFSLYFITKYSEMQNKRQQGIEHVLKSKNSGGLLIIMM